MQNQGKGWLIFLFLFVTFGIYAVEKEPKLVPKNKVPKLLKSVAYATIRSTLLASYNFKESYSTIGSECSENFPKLPGQFFCNYLEIPEQVDSLSLAGSSSDGEFNSGDLVVEEGLPQVFISKTASPFLNGKVVKVEHEGETSLLFYKPSGQISHYKNGNTVVIFKWQNVPKNAEITGLIIVKLGSEFFPNTVYEFNF